MPKENVGSHPRMRGNSFLFNALKQVARPHKEPRLTVRHVLPGEHAPGHETQGLHAMI